VFKNFIWDFLGRFSGQIVAFTVSIVLTRLLTPGEYGIMGMSAVIIAVAAMFLDLGFSRALIQQQEVTPVQYATVFYINLLLGAVLTLACFCLASPVAGFYHQPLIKPVFRVLSFSFLLNGLNIIPSSILYKRMQFRMLTIFNVSAAIISGIVGIVMAYKHFGVWSLVAQTLVSAGLAALFNIVYLRWRPVFAFNLTSVKPLWNFGRRLFGAGFLDVVFTRFDTFIIGKLFLPSILGYYSRAQSLDVMVRNFSSGSIMSVLFPFISKNQSNRKFLIELYYKYLHYICFISIGLSGLLFVISKPLFIFLFTKRWLFSAELFQLMAVMGFVWPVSSLICNMIEGVGNSRLYLKLEMLKKLTFLPVYIFGFWFGIKGFIVCYIAGYYVACYLNISFLSAEFKIKTWDQILLLGKYFLCGAVAAFAGTFALSAINIEVALVRIVIGAATFCSAYLLLNYVFKTGGRQVVDHGLQKINLLTNDKRNKNLSSTL